MQFKGIFFLSVITLSTQTHAMLTGVAVTVLGALVGGAAGYTIHDRFHYASNQNCKSAFNSFNRLVTVPNPFDQAAKEKSVEPLIPVFHTCVNQRYKNESPLAVADLASDVVTQASNRMAQLLQEIDDLKRYTYFDTHKQSMPDLQILESSHHSFYGAQDDGIFSKAHLSQVQAQILKDLHNHVQDELKQNEKKNSGFSLHDRLKKLEYHIGLYEKFVKYNNCMTPKDQNLIGQGLHMVKTIKEDPQFQLELKVKYFESYVLTLECRISQLQYRISTLEDENRRLRFKN